MDDLDINWHYYGFRVYDPAIARFTSVDPISDQFPNLSTFNYADNNPIVNIDLHGLQGVNTNWARAWANAYGSENQRRATNAAADGRDLGVLVGATILSPLDELAALNYASKTFTGIGRVSSFAAKTRKLYNSLKYSKKLKNKEGILDANGNFRKLTKDNQADAAADALAESLGGTSRVKIEGFANEFDSVSDKFIGQITDKITLGSKFRNQAKDTFKAAKETGRDVFYQFTKGNQENTKELVNKLYEYSQRYDVNVTIKFGK